MFFLLPLLPLLPLLLLLLLLPPPALTSPLRRASSCNGSPALCSRRYSNVSLIGAHDSAFVGVLPTDNQFVAVAAQLAAGIRFLEVQTHNRAGVIELCHTSCLEKDAGPLLDYLTVVAGFLDSNPDEVLTLLVTNQDAISVADFAAVMEQSGVAAYSYTPTQQLAIEDWPTLEDMISANTRLVTFMDYNSNLTLAPSILPEFSYFFETAYDVTSFSSCALDRPAGASGDGLMYIVNHFKDVDVLGLLIPDAVEAAQTNAATGAGSIGEQVALCEQTWGGRVPNVVLVDYFNVGDVFTAQNNLNHLS